ncbi:MAG: two-component regulator propeller domain-containing protein, partial [Limisphaerales bacterium]
MTAQLWAVSVASTREEIAVLGSQPEFDSSSEFVVSVWRTGEGLPVNEIFDLKETSDGYLWIGTYRGLVRFDGLRFQSFYTTPTGLRYGLLMGPLETDHRGRLWIAPDQVGLLRLEGNTFTEVLTNSPNIKERSRSL